MTKIFVPNFLPYLLKNQPWSYSVTMVFPKTSY
jgi:hypothetical protein